MSNSPFFEKPQLRDGEPCPHPGCLSHLSHPCEGCGRVGGIAGAVPIKRAKSRKIPVYKDRHPHNPEQNT